MTNYTKSTNFASKDSLASGNPLKIVKGTEIDSEFNNIATAVATKADVASPTFTGVPVAPTASAGTNTTQVATTAFVAAANALQDTATALKAPLASPALTGTPTAPTAAVDTTTTQLATTAFVIAQAATVAPLANGTAAVGTSKKYARQDHVHAEGGIGIGQTWQDVTASRVSGTTYTNSTGKPIMAVVTISVSGGGASVSFIVGGVTIPFFGFSASGGSGYAGGTVIIPTGATYSCTGIINSWMELR